MRASGSPEIRGDVWVEGWSSVGVDIGVTDARFACEYGGTRHTRNTRQTAVLVKVNSGWCRKSQEVRKRQTEMVGIQKTWICFHGAHRHTHTSIHGLHNQARKTERLLVTIWKKIAEESTRAIRGFVVCG